MCKLYVSPSSPVSVCSAPQLSEEADHPLVRGFPRLPEESCLVDMGGYGALYLLVLPPPGNGLSGGTKLQGKSTGIAGSFLLINP